MPIFRVAGGRRPVRSCGSVAFIGADELGVTGLIGQTFSGRLAGKEADERT